MKKQYKIIFALILVATLALLTAFSCSAATSNQRDGVANWTITEDGILTDGINEYNPYLVDGRQVELTALGFELTHKMYYYEKTVKLGGEEYEVCAAYDFAPVVFLEAVNPDKDYNYPTYAYYKGTDDRSITQSISGYYDTVRAICYDYYTPIAFDIPHQVVSALKKGVSCETEVINMSELSTDWYELYGFDSTDILARYESFLFQIGEKWCYLDPELIPDNYFYADGSLAIDKGYDISVRVLKGEALSAVQSAFSSSYTYEIKADYEGDGLIDNIIDEIWEGDGAIVTACVVIGIFGIVIPLGLGIYLAIDIFVLKKGKRSISTYVMAGADAVWLISGIIFFILLFV